MGRRGRRTQRRTRQWAARWLAVFVSLLAFSALPARADECPPGTPPEVDRRACAAMAACLRAEPTSSSTVSVREQLYRAAARYERCGIKGWSVAVGEGDAHRRLAAASKPCPEIPMCEPVPVCPSLLEQLGAGAAVCAACGLGGLGAGWAARGGDP